MITLEDLETHQSEWVAPVSQAYHGLRLYEIPPNGQGLTALIALGLLRHHDVRQYPMDSADCIHLQVEAMKIAFSEVSRHVADPNSMRVDVKDLLSSSFLADRAQEIQMDRANFPVSTLPSERGTVYLATADEKGLMVSYIQSNYWGFGSGIVVPGTGISLQNQGCGFTLEKGHPNCLAGGKRPYHTIIPAMVTGKDGSPIMAFGVMGAHMQPQGHVQMIVRIFDYGLNPQAASDAPRWFLSEEMELGLEPGMEPSVFDDLLERGHRLMDAPDNTLFGGAQLILKTKNGYCGASDHRKDGQAVGF